jgi:hypothetical protein
VVLRDSSRSRIEANAWYVPRSSGETDTNLKLTLVRKGTDAGTSEITLKPDEVALLHEVTHEFLGLAGEREGGYVVIPIAADVRLDASETARRLVSVLREPGVMDGLAAMDLSADVAGALHGAARITELRGAVAELREHLTAGRTLESVYQDWCDRHCWAFGNVYVARDEVRHIAVGDQVDLLVRSSANGLRDAIELKRPSMKVIVWDKTHRSWYWSRDVAAAIGQCHRYLDTLHGELQALMRDHPDIVAYHPRAIIVVGRSAEWAEDQQRALHGLNARLHSITVMTYDHLLAQAEAVLATLA